MRNSFENCDVGSHYEGANFVAMLANICADVRRIEANAAPALETSPDGETATEGLVAFSMRRERSQAV